MKWLILFLVLFTAVLHAAEPADKEADAPTGPACPGEDDEAKIVVKTKDGPTLIVCGFEDREVKAVKPKRSFTDFDIYSVMKGKEPQKVFSGAPSETYWLKPLANKGIQMEELWFFSEEPRAALKSEITCTADACKQGEEKCVFKMKRNPFPKALAEFKKKSNEGQLKEEGEELIDQVFAQAVTGDKAAKEFYSGEPPGLDPALKEIFKSNQSKLKLGCKP